MGSDYNPIPDRDASDGEGQAALAALESAAVPDVTDTSYQAQLAALGEYAQTAFNEVLAQYRFLGLLAGIKGPNDTDQDVEDARDTVMEALAEFLQAGPLGGQIEDVWDQILADRESLERDLSDDRTLSDEDRYLVGHVLGNAAPSGHPFDQLETTLEQMAQGAARYNNISADIERLPEPYRSRMQRLLDQYAQMAALEDVRRANRRAAVVAWFRRMWEGVRDYYNENMELIRNGQWLLATGRIAIDAAIFAAEEVVVAGIVTAIIGLTGGLAVGMALALRGAVRAMLSVVRQGSRVVRNVRAAYVFKIEIRKIEPGVLYSNPIPINFNIGRRLDYEKSIDVEHDLTPDEARAQGEGGQGSLEPDADAPEAGTNGGRAPDSKVTRLSAGEVKTDRGGNTKTTTFDPESGRPISESGTIREDFGSTPRRDNATAVGRLGAEGDHGGHLGGHRFYGDTPDEGIAPQARNLNTGAWKTMENEWAAWTRLGYEVNYKIDVYPPGAVRPDEFRTGYTVRDPQTGEILYENKSRFKNRAGQSFSRITWRQMQSEYGSLK